MMAETPYIFEHLLYASGIEWPWVAGLLCLRWFILAEGIYTSSCWRRGSQWLVSK